MKRIAMSLATIATVATLVVGVTGAYFSDTATITDNTFSTGTLEIRVTGQPTLAGATFSPTAPGVMYYSPEYHINNYGPSYFDGPSNLAAKKLLLSVTNPNDFGSGLWDQVRVKVETNRGWATWQVSYEGKLKYLGVKDLLPTRWSELAPGDSQMVKYTIWLPETGVDQSALMGKTLTWDWQIEGRTN
mgnify:CR=1 FL=1